MQSQQKHKNIIKLKIIFLLLFIFVSNSVSTYAQKEYVVVLDAGHGGKDPGNLGNGFKEKSIALKVALKVGEKLKQHKDVKVIFTRKKDVFIDLWKRGDIANHAKADLFVSIHCDSHTSNAYGAGTFVLGLRGNKKNLEIAKRENAVILLEDNFRDKYKGFDPNSAESVIGLSLLQEENLDKSLAIASLIQNNFAFKLKRNNRKVKQDNFQVLRETIMPSVLVELGFLTNKKEGRFLNSKIGQTKMANEISDAIYNYIKNLKLNTVIAEVTTKAPVNEIEFKVQVASGRNKIATKSYNFKGLKNIERVQVGSYYKYYYGNSSSYKSVEKARRVVQAKGYKTAFIVAFKNGKKIAVQEALKMQ
ncbi:N-acetylmuramoyl-L-alanine amidase [Polaribacter sp. ALD11]|uniref:N-acetylmuramoyl-L-alanine amidase family protein n=1 Tax=Polaribacter sp. ALD11 TaxID=2058137 RepID=UPI000C30427B|nr:N-acetylmuramoyl-L-alanine amidase [Polaribacter sp. ALD11]AUC86524.1 N-acetylmuramoyl-L-alanine amidase [Polaribacter sp. ALD11]